MLSAAYCTFRGVFVRELCRFPVSLAVRTVYAADVGRRENSHVNTCVYFVCPACTRFLRQVKQERMKELKGLNVAFATMDPAVSASACLGGMLVRLFLTPHRINAYTFRRVAKAVGGSTRCSCLLAVDGCRAHALRYLALG